MDRYSNCFPCCRPVLLRNGSGGAGTAVDCGRQPQIASSIFGPPVLRAIVRPQQPRPARPPTRVRAARTAGFQSPSKTDATADKRALGEHIHLLLHAHLTHRTYHLLSRNTTTPPAHHYPSAMADKVGRPNLSGPRERCADGTETKRRVVARGGGHESTTETEIPQQPPRLQPRAR